MLGSKQACILAACNLLILIVITVNVFVMSPKENVPNKKVASIIIAVILCFMLVIIYSMDCMVHRDFHAIAWAIVAFTIIATLMYIALFLYAYMVPRGHADKDTPPYEQGSLTK